MKPVLFEWMLIPFILWGMFQGLLYFHANQVQMSLNLAAYEGSKEAAVQGRYDDKIYQNMKNYLVKVFHYNPSAIHIQGTETLTKRGDYLTVSISVPKPRMYVLPMFSSHEATPNFTEQKTVMSEYIP